MSSDRFKMDRYSLFDEPQTSGSKRLGIRHESGQIQKKENEERKNDFGFRRSRDKDIETDIIKGSKNEDEELMSHVKAIKAL